jgi:hypothetical protein
MYLCGACTLVQVTRLLTRHTYSPTIVSPLSRICFTARLVDWRPEIHQLYPEPLRNTIETLLKLCLRHPECDTPRFTKALVAYLPIELLYELFTAITIVDIDHASLVTTVAMPASITQPPHPEQILPPAVQGQQTPNASDSDDDD